MVVDTDIEVEACWIDEKHIGIVCPKCRSSYNKDGSGRKNSYPKLHLFGSNGDPFNRIEHRISHCDKGTNTFNIIINGSTKRI